MECSRNEQDFRVERFAGLPAELIGPEEDAMGMIEEEWRAEFPKEAGGLARQLAVRNARLHTLEIGGGRLYWNNCLG